MRDVGTFVEKHGDLDRARSLFESRLELLERNVRTREHAAGGFSAGAVADDEHTALLRDERRERSFEREGAGTRHQDSGVFGGRMPATRRRRLRTSSIIEMNAASAGDGQQVMASRTDASMETGPGVSSRQALTCLFMIFNGRLFSQG